MQKNFWALRTLKLLSPVVVLGVLDEVVNGSEGLSAGVTHRHGDFLRFGVLLSPEIA